MDKVLFLESEGGGLWFQFCHYPTLVQEAPVLVRISNTYQMLL